ncbi:site-specific integrase [Alginatibacterium sediminis]|uniref:Site-specific integrase n=1 Tax=Alginatibacterium sediminis TaxID=2164068 RepID=A0A420E745_9ALTE|nr:site-specific integrase [Alginatibacterium sediminis]RKF14336.1 site-specific integrase [Alginatibacterium sediminis]
MELHREQLIFQNGERFSCLSDINGVPDFWTTLFLTTHYRGSTQETMRNISNVLVHFLLWDEMQEQPFFEKVIRIADADETAPVSQFTPPVFLSTLEARSLAYHCKIQTKVARRKQARKSENNVISMRTQLPASVVPDEVVGVKLHRQRLKVVAEFLHFIVDVGLRHYSHYAYYLDAAGKIKQLIFKQRPKRQGARATLNDPDKKAPPPEVFEEIMRIAEPSCPDNPFTDLVRDRNYLIVRVLYDTGMRVGELLQLKVLDINFAAQTISIVRRHDDPEDIWRALEPNAKTLERDLPISLELTDLLRDYVTGERRKMVSAFPASQSHGFLFVSNKSTKGQPLGVKQCPKLLLKIARDEALVAFIEQQGIKVDKLAGAHAYRHNRNNLISRIIDANNQLAREEGRVDEIISEKKEKQVRMYLMGHSDEKSAEVYNLRHTKESAEKINMALMEDEANKVRNECGKGGSELAQEELKRLIPSVLGMAYDFSDNKEEK